MSVSVAEELLTAAAEPGRLEAMKRLDVLDARTHDFTSMTQVLASNYQVIVDPDLAEAARDVLARPEPTES